MPAEKPGFFEYLGGNTKITLPETGFLTCSRSAIAWDYPKAQFLTVRSILDMSRRSGVYNQK
ncbi:MAG: hypothetical protein GDA48_17995 [Hormoscilla sp. GM102CHS1]|nr:hypothetical protein [Hormoscilla sp. GM102CHS1]